MDILFQKMQSFDRQDKIPDLLDFHFYDEYAEILEKFLVVQNL